MFECPKCGYRDLPAWKCHRYMLYVVYCKIDDLEVVRPDLVAALREKKDLDDGPYRYHLTSSGYVLRVHKDLKDFLYRRDLIERQKYEAPSQAKLKEFIG